MAFQKKKIDNIHPQALQQIKDVVDGKTPSQTGFGGKTPDVSGFTRTALDQIKGVIGGGSEKVARALWSVGEIPTRVHPEYNGESELGVPVYWYTEDVEGVTLLATYSEEEPASLVSDDVCFFSMGDTSNDYLVYACVYDDGTHGQARLVITFDL